MPTIDLNKEFWNKEYAWPLFGDEFSKPWGGTEMMWLGMMLPRIRSFLPVDGILEIAPGQGRWTQYLKDQCRRMWIVDLSESCIETCKRRFASENHVQCFVNDGYSLDMIPDRSIDFIFSFDSLVHAEADVLRSYILQSAKKLTPNGVGFIHHSNLGSYPTMLKIRKMIFKRAGTVVEPTRIAKYLADHDLIPPDGWRSESMTCEAFQEFCEQAGLVCISQEIVNWRNKRYLTDCMSVFTPKGSTYSQKHKVFKNRSFMAQAELLATLANLYASPNSREVRATTAG
jgi:2-polyprenyl-3-methyl-5-hydroxy-6-metoxy-1,4-benzoquinol methylase